MGKMKKLCFGIFMYACMCMLLPATAMAEIKTGDGYSYDTETKTMTVSGEDVFTNAWQSDSYGLGKLGQEVEKVVIGNDVKEIGVNAFSYCLKITELDLSNATSLETIGNYAFYATNIAGTVVIPSNVRTIGEHAFSYCTKLEFLDLSQANSLEVIGKYAFKSASSLTGTLEIPSSVKEFQERVFEGCTGITGLDLSKATSLEIIGNLTFSGTRIAGTVVIPSNVKIIGESAFYGQKITELDLSKATSLEVIRNSAFFNCQELEGPLVFPSSITEIGDGAFYNCGKLEEVQFLGMQAPTTVGAGIFEGISSEVKVLLYEGATGYDDDGDGKAFGLTIEWIPIPVVDPGNPGGGSSGGGTSTLKTTVASGDMLSASNLAALAKGNRTYTVTGAEGTKVVLDKDAVKGLAAEGGKLIVTISKASAQADGRMTYATTATLGGKPVASVSGKMTVTLPCAADNGTVSVWEVSENGTMNEISAKYDEKAEMVTFEVTAFGEYILDVAGATIPVEPTEPTEPTTRNPFVDVKESDWSYEAVQFAYENGLFAGTSEDTFSPNEETTRAMLWAVLARQAGQDMTGGETWYANAQAWAMENGISDGTSPTRKITRQEFVTMLWRISESPATPSSERLSTFADATEISDYAEEAMVWAVEQGLVVGGEGKLMPQESATRAQIAAIMMRSMEKTQA